MQTDLSENQRPISRHLTGRIEDIELLRAVAILMVLLEHAHGNLISAPSAAFDLFHTRFSGAAGVDLFFAISGFVIARNLIPLLARCENVKACLKVSADFWWRRIWRLLPSAWLWLLLILLGARFFNHHGTFGSYTATLAASFAAFLQFYNLHFAQCFMRYECGANFVFWSLSLEEQFYFLLPFLLLPVRGNTTVRHGLLILLVLIQLFSPRNLLFVMLRSDALLLGVLLASFSLSPRTSVKKSTSTFIRCVVVRRGLAGIFILLMGFVAASPFWPSLAPWAPWRFGLLAVLGVTLVWLAAADRNDLIPKGFIRQSLLWMGSRSYALYLCHIPLFFVSREVWSSGSTPLLVLTALMLILAAAELNYRFVEMPLRKKVWRHPDHISNPFPG